MYRIIGGDQQPYGPVSAEEVRQWISQGRLNGQSLAIVEGGEWKALATFPEFAEALRTQTVSPQPGLTAASAQTWTAQTLAAGPRLPIGQCLSLGWKLVSDNFGLLFGACFVVWLLNVACHRIPLIGSLAWAVLQGVFYGGLFMIFLKRIRGQPASVSDVFSGFSSNFAQLMLAGFLTTVLSFLATACCLVLPGIYLMVAWRFSVPLVADKRLEFWSGMELSRKVVTRVWFETLGLLLLAFLPTILMSAFLGLKSFMAVFPMVADAMNSSRPPDFETMMRLMRQSSAFAPPLWLQLLPTLVYFLNLPWATAALMYAYENLFGSRTQTTT